MTPMLLVQWSLAGLLAIFVLMFAVAAVRATFHSVTKDGSKPTLPLHTEPLIARHYSDTPSTLFGSDFTLATQTPPSIGEQDNKENNK